MKIVTSLSFQGQCREAFEFYADVLGGRITAAVPYGDGPPDAWRARRNTDWLMHCWLEVGDQALMGADMDVGLGAERRQAEERLRRHAAHRRHGRGAALVRPAGGGRQGR